jgi:Flp pilus assembly pilin Flp
MQKLVRAIACFCADEDGLGVAEYGLILVLASLFAGLVFSVASGACHNAICAAFSQVVSQLGNSPAGASNVYAS